MNTAILALEDGTVFEGTAFGAPKDSGGEVVFNTAITGYQEIFTDPSYSGQIVVLTNPQIGNYGANNYDREAGKPHIEGLIVRELSSIASNWQSIESADAFLAQNGIAVASGIDTRALVRHLRTRGVMRGVLSVTGGDRGALVERARKIPSMAGLDLATRVSTPESYRWTEP
ncbi:MAG TPA: carbamoyl-phosphate synthase domain-containing protein, partial [Bryobacteraceae bacterium]|nr:carbamoyl-phosphate synthase domain-containing protein [Bryobacteraceae bacterium]